MDKVLRVFYRCSVLISVALCCGGMQSVFAAPDPGPVGVPSSTQENEKGFESDVKTVLPKGVAQGSDISSKKGARGIVEIIKVVAIRFVYPIVLVIALISAILGVRNIMFKEDENAYQTGINYLIYGTIGIVLISIAWFLTVRIVGAEGDAGLLDGGVGFSSESSLASNLNRLALPFVTIVSHLASGVLFVILLWQVLRIVTSGSEDAGKQAQRVLIRNTIGIIIILGAKWLVHLVFDLGAGGKFEAVQLNQQTLSPVYQIINISLGLTFFVMIVMIIYMAFQLLLKPTDESAAQQLRRSILYIFIGLLLIGFAYVIVNFLVIGRVDPKSG